MTAEPGIPRVVICGGGVAGVEALLALRALVESEMDLHLVAPNGRFVYQPLAVAAPFGPVKTDLFDLAEIAREMRVTLHVDSLAQVDAEDRFVRLESGVGLDYDALVIAVGAKRRDWLEGALHFSGAASVAAFSALLRQVDNRADRRVCFVYPESVGWALPLYELALLTASHLVDRGIIGAELTVVTPEIDPLALFGPAASDVLLELLATHEIGLRAGARAEKIQDGLLHLHPAATLEVDRVVALSRLEGPALPGLPCDAAGFIVVDERSRVSGLEDVYAAGDGTSFPVKQGGIATQQADTAAEAIAAKLGAAVRPSPTSPTLRAMLLTGVAPVYLRAQIAGAGGDSFEIAEDPLWWPPSKIAGRYLAPFLADHRPLSRETLKDRPLSSEDPAKLRRSHDRARELVLMFAERDAGDRDFESALQWLDVLEWIDGVLPPGYVQKRADWQRRAQPGAERHGG